MKAILISLLCAGCFDSLVDDRCSTGYTYAGGQCVAATAPDGATVDAPIVDGVLVDGVLVDSPDALVADAPDAAPDALVDALVCPAPAMACDGFCTDVTIDPLNCGYCGHVCPTGICSAGVCQGAPRGHVVAIGHDYAAANQAMERVLGNAVALGQHYDIGVARWRGSSPATAVAGTTAGIGHGLHQVGRPWHQASLPTMPAAFTGVDVVIVDAQNGDPAAEMLDGMTWAAAIDNFLTSGGVIITLEGAGDTTDAFAAGANLYTATSADVSGQPIYVLDGADSVTYQVLSPYAAASSSVSLAGAGAAAIGLSDGTPVVVHLTH